MKIGIVGLPNVGKSTLFNALTKSKSAMAANYPFCTIDPNVGVVEVPDARLQKLVELVKPEKTIPAIVEFVDIAGLVKGASEGEGLGNQFLAHIRECEAIAQVVRVFSDGNVIHVHGNVDPKRDMEVLETELILADLQTVQKRLSKAKNEAKSGDKKKAAYAVLVEKVEKMLSEGKKIIDSDFTPEEKIEMEDLHLLTAKPLLYIANVSENEIQNFDAGNFKKTLNLKPEQKVIPISAKIEEELGALSDEEARMFLQDLGLKETGLNALIQAAYETLGLITYFTAGPRRFAPGPFTLVTRARKQRGSSTPTSKKGLFVRKPSLTTITSKPAANRRRKKKVSCAPKERSTSSKMETSCISGSITDARYGDHSGNLCS